MTSSSKKRPIDATHLGNSYSPDLNGKRDFSIFSVDPHWRRAAQPLPSFLITEETVESRALQSSVDLYTTPHGGRYPVLMFPEESPRPLAVTARTFAMNYYYEGLCTSAHDNLGKRIDCFRASEILYLHAAIRDDVRAHTGLGRIYLHDRCEGHYFDAFKNNLFLDLVLPGDQIRQKAHDHLQHAASKGDVEGIYLYGDVLRDGCGCEVDLKRAFDCYLQARQVIVDQEISTPTLRGEVELRLGRAYEEGEGCDIDWATALHYYERAADNLGKLVDDGTWYYDTELAQATRGIMRMRQEIDLSR